MLYHERERKNKENANFVHIVYLLSKLSKIFDEAFFIDVSILCRSIGQVRLMYGTYLLQATRAWFN